MPTTIKTNTNTNTKSKTKSKTKSNTKSNTKTKTCKQFCTTYVSKRMIQANNFQKDLSKLNYNLNKTKTTKMSTDDKKKLEEKNKKELKKLEATMNKDCKKMYCNKTCKNTLMESGKDKYPPIADKFKKDKKMYKLLMDLQKKNKQRIFGDKDNVLKDGFYEKLSSVKVNRLKKEGATSACVEMLID